MHGYTKDDAKSVVKVEAPAKPMVPVEKAVEVESYTADIDRNKFTKIVVVFKQTKLAEFIHAMDQLNITGITVTNVMGCGMQSGAKNYYRGTAVETTLLPKVKAEIVVCKVPARTVIDAAKSALYTGSYGDGKIFVYDIENVIKVRTGEEGYDALQDSDE